MELWQYALIALGAFLVGLGKGGLPGVGNLAVVLMAIALPARDSVGVLLPILISADVIAVFVYRRHALWSMIGRLAPWTAAGVWLGYAVFEHVDDERMRVLIGGILLTMAAAHWTRKALAARAQRAGRTPEEQAPHSLVFVGVTGIVGGFATMVANAAGPVAALFFIAAGLPKYAFIGTSAWFFLLVNGFKVPFMVGVGVIDAASFALSASFMVFSVSGATVAPFIVRFINQRVFEALIWFFVVLGGLKLIVS